jgi:hypothetical protein
VAQEVLVSSKETAQKQNDLDRLPISASSRRFFLRTFLEGELAR